MNLRTISASAVAASVLLSFGVASADTTALSVTCAGTPAASSITWTASPVGGVAPVALLWGNGATTTSQTVSYTPGTYSINIQATDASSTVATSTCSAIVAQSAPSITSFTANPSSISYGQSSLLSWVATNASSTSIDNGVGVVPGTSVLVVPTQTTTYTLTAQNPLGSVTSAVTVTVATSTASGTSLQERIQALLQQIAGLQQQLAALLSNHGNATSSPAVIPPGQVGKAACISLNRDLHEGDSGDDVMSIQQMLAADPSTGFNVAPTGYFGSMTAQAMIRFQEKNGIASSTQSTGIVGPLTRGFFERHCGEGLMHQEQEGQNWASTTASTTPEWHVNMPMLPYMPGNSGESHGQNSDHGNNQGGNSQDN